MPRFSAASRPRSSRTVAPWREQQVVRWQQPLGDARVTRRVHAGGVAEEREHHGSLRVVHTFTRSPSASCRSRAYSGKRSTVSRFVQPPFSSQRLRQVPVVQRQPGQDAGVEQFVDEALVEVDALPG